MTEKATITIDGTTYNVDELSEAAKQQILNIRVVDQEISRLQQQLIIAQTARSAFAQALQAALSN